MLLTVKQIEKRLNDSQKIIEGLTNINGITDKQLKYFRDVIGALQIVKDIYKKSFDGENVKISF